MKKIDIYFFLIILSFFSISISITLLHNSEHFNNSRYCTPPFDLPTYRPYLNINNTIHIESIINNNNNNNRNDNNYYFNVNENYTTTIPSFDELPKIFSCTIDDYIHTNDHNSNIDMFNWSNLMWVWLQFINQDIISSHSIFLDGSNLFSHINTNNNNDNDNKIYHNDSGKLKYQIIHGKIFPPFNMTNDIDNPLLYSLYVIWWREQHYWCDRIKYQDGNFDYSGDKIFNIVRHIIAAEIQAITYREFLPILVGSKSGHFIENEEMVPPCFTNIQEVYIPVYSTIEPIYYLQKIVHNVTLFEEYLYGASQLYQTLIVDSLDIRNPFTGTFAHIPQQILISDNRFIFEYLDGIDSLLLGASLQRSGYRDTCISPSIRNKSLRSIQQMPASIISYQELYNYFIGKEQNHIHCLQIVSDPNFCRKYYFNLISSQQSQSQTSTSTSTITNSDFCPISSFYDINNNSIISNENEDKDKNEKDEKEKEKEKYIFNLFFGLLIEKNTNKHSFLGFLAKQIFKHQFIHIKQNDYYFYLWDKIINNYKSELHNTRLSTIILRNTLINQRHLHPNVFLIK